MKAPKTRFFFLANLYEARKQYRKNEEGADAFVDDHLAIFQLLMGPKLDELLASASWYDSRYQLAYVTKFVVGQLIWGSCKDKVVTELVARHCKIVIDSWLAKPQVELTKAACQDSGQHVWTRAA